MKYQKVQLKESLHSRISRLTMIDKILEERFEEEVRKNGHDTRRARQLELAWNLMTARILKLQYRMNDEKI